MAMLEAFVHDPLINWRLLKPSEASGTAAVASVSAAPAQRPPRGALGRAVFGREVVHGPGRST